jgi:UDP-N-acetylmuramate dehydrogenase
MSDAVINPSQIDALQSFFTDRLKKDQVMSRHTVMQVGGPADFLVTVENAADLEASVRFLWSERIPFLLLGGGSNTLISDDGIREVVLINEARQIKFMDEGEHPRIWAESGASFGNLSRRAGAKGWSGLEWSSGIPGTVGGAVVNNAGAFGADMSDSLEMADILHPSGNTIQRSNWSVDDFDYAYRYSVIKSGKKQAVVLSATFKMERSTPEEVKATISAIAEKRISSQPSGASLGSMFKNPPDDYAGRLIEEAGLKGTRVGNVEISTDHANFFVNRGGASANDIATLIALVKDQVYEKYGKELELEIQFIGDW